MLNYQKIQENDLSQTVGINVELKKSQYFQPAQLDGRWGKLIPLQTLESDSTLFRSMWRTVERESHKGIWTYLPYDEFVFQVQLEGALKSNFSLEHAQHYFVQVGHQAIGWVGLINIREKDKVAEIGNLYFSDQLRQTTAATEVIYLLLEECFRKGFRKIEWRCDDLNEASINAAVRFGFLYEGTLRQDRIVKGRNRNTACFSMLDEEWKRLSLAFQDWLKQENFTVERQQKIRLEEFMKQYPITERLDKENKARLIAIVG